MRGVPPVRIDKHEFRMAIHEVCSRLQSHRPRIRKRGVLGPQIKVGKPGVRLCCVGCLVSSTLEYWLDTLVAMDSTKSLAWVASILMCAGCKRRTVFADGIYRMNRTFDALGNFLSITVDRNGDGMFTGTGESSESRTFNDAGEIMTRTSLDPAVGNPTWFADGAIGYNNLLNT